jgi:hypothetical protein
MTAGLNVRVNVSESKYERRISLGRITDPLIQRHGIAAVLLAMLAIKQAMAVSLEENVDDFAAKSLDAAEVKPQGNIEITLQTIQHGPQQTVCLAKVGNSDRQFIVKGSFPHGFSLWDRHPLAQLLAFGGADFTQYEFQALSAAARFSQTGEVIAPTALVKSPTGTPIYSQAYAPGGFMEINPCPYYLRQRGLLGINHLSVDADQDILSPLPAQGDRLILARTLKLMVLIYLRSQAFGNPLLFMPSFYAGDVLANNQHEIRCVGSQNMLSVAKLLEDARKQGEPCDNPEKNLFGILDWMYPTMGFAMPGESFSRLGLKDLLDNGISAGFGAL